MEEIGLEVPALGLRPLAATRREEIAADDRLPDHGATELHPRRQGHRHRRGRRALRPARRRGPGRQPGRPDPRGAVDRRLEGVRARGDARRRRQLRRRLLHRELRPHGRAHRRLHHGGAGPDADRRRVPGHARRRLRLPAPGRRRDRRLQRAVRRRPGDGAAGHHRDEPPGVALVARWPRRPRASRSPRSPPASPSATCSTRSPTTSPKATPASLRAHHRLRRDQGPALGLREAPRRRGAPRHPDAVGRRGHGHRPHLLRVAAEGAALPGAGPGRAQRRPGRGRARRRSPTTSCCARIGRRRRPTASSSSRRRCAAASASTRSWPRTGIDPWFVRQLARIVGRARSASPRRRRPRARPTSAGPSGSASPTRSWPTCAAPTRGGRAGRPPGRTACGPTFKTVDTCAAEFEAFTPYHYATYEEEDEVRPSERARVDHPRLGPQPDRPGHRVRLLLRARLHDPARRRLRDGHDQLQPRDRLDRLRHVGPPVLRAADRRGRGQRARRRAGGRRDGGGRHRLPRRPDAAQAGRLAPARAGARHEPGLHRPGRGPRALERAVPRAGDPPAARAARRRPRPRRWPSPGGSATRCCCARATCSAAAPWRSSTTTTACAASCSR